MQVREIMTENPACCTPDTTLQEVARLMVENDCGCIPVVDSYTVMRPIGTITDRDITVRTVAASQNPVDMKASDIMTTDIATVMPFMNIEECFDVMEDREIRRVLVVDERGRCCGIVAQADVAQYATNPIRTSRLVREISESAPSSNQRMYRNRRSRNNESYMSGGSILPLLLGIGTGAALLYWLNSEDKTSHSQPVRHQVTTRHINTPRSIDTTPSDLSTGTTGIQTGTREPITGTVESSNRDDDTITDRGIGRSATPGNSF